MIIIYVSHAVNKARTRFAKNSVKMIKKFNPEAKIYISNSKGVKYSRYLEKLASDENDIFYNEYENNCFLDFGKYYYAMKNLIDQGKINSGDDSHIYFINDSVIITGDMSKFFTLKTDIVGCLDSYEYQYHYQSYMFGINLSHVDKFMTYIDTFMKKYQACGCSWSNIVHELEIPMIHEFGEKEGNRSCYINTDSGTKYIYNKNYKQYIGRGLKIVKFKSLITHIQKRGKVPRFIRKEIDNSYKILETSSVNYLKHIKY